MFRVATVECPSCREDVRFPLTSDDDIEYALVNHARITEDVLTFELYERETPCDVRALLALVKD